MLKVLIYISIFSITFKITVKAENGTNKKYSDRKKYAAVAIHQT